ncbi:helix-turn-helix transcriptional regulator, partial [bacterium]|nr:helix-turn-helix transcriptional regulator [bacterium]
MDIRTELRDLMKSRGLSNVFVANAIGVGKSTVSMWLSDKYTGDNETIDIHKAVSYYFMDNLPCDFVP